MKRRSVSGARFVLSCLVLFWAGPRAAWAEEPAAQPFFLFEQWSGPAIRAYYTVPEDLAPDAPVVIVMHGMSRTAREYHEVWGSLAQQHGFVVVVPEFTQEAFPGSQAYNLGNIFGENLEPIERQFWSYSAIEPLFDALRQRFGLSVERYAIYGHSAGAQFVHRFLMHIPSARVSRAVIANAGWYTLPDFGIAWPYGLKGSKVSPRGLSHILGMDLTILLGDQDIDTTDDSLRKSPEAMQQGPHRLARGYYYLAAGRFAAKRLQAPLRWKLGTVQGADHDNAKMGPAAVQFLLP